MKLVACTKKFLKHWEKFWFESDKLRTDLEKLALTYNLKEHDYKEMFGLLRDLKKIKK